MVLQLCKLPGNKALLLTLGLVWTPAPIPGKPTPKGKEKAWENVSGVTDHITQVDGRMESGTEREYSGLEREQSTTACLMTTLDTAQEI